MLTIINRGMLAAVLLMVLPAWAAAQEAVVPNFFDPQDRFERPSLADLPRLRFLTVTDFPPFSYVDGENRLVGYHVELARALCEELRVENKCEIQAVPFAELESALAAGNGEALIAGLAVTADTRERLAFTRHYFRLPARFLAREGASLEQALADRMAGRTVAVVGNTAHAAFLARAFPQARALTVADGAAAAAALREGRAEAWFGSGLRMILLMRRPEGRGFAFAGGPYLDPAYFGRGLAIAVRPDDTALLEALNHALVALNEDRTLEELYLRHFPIGLF